MSANYFATSTTSTNIHHLYWSPLFCIAAETDEQRVAFLPDPNQARSALYAMKSVRNPGAKLTLLYASSPLAKSGFVYTTLHLKPTRPAFAYYSALSMQSSWNTNSWHGHIPFQRCAPCAWLNNTLRDLTDPGSSIEEMSFMKTWHNCGMDLKEITGNLESEMHPTIATSLARLDPHLEAELTSSFRTSLHIGEIWNKLTNVSRNPPPAGAECHLKDTLLTVCSRREANAVLGHKGEVIIQEPLRQYAAEWGSSCVPIISNTKDLLEGVLTARSRDHCKIWVDVTASSDRWPPVEDVFSGPRKE
jgi:hypothetical protein